MINCNNVSVTIRGEAVLKNISCNIPRNKFTAIIGKNGSGKTTLANCVSRQIRYTGQITVDSVDISTMSNNALSKKLAYLPQNLPIPSVTVEELIGFGRIPHIGLQRKLMPQDMKAIAAALSKVELQPFSHRAIADLSGGERQKAYLAMILAQETELLILDEPSTYLDAAAQLQFLTLLKELSVSGKTVAAILHDLSLAVSLAEHIVILDSGMCVFSDKTEVCLAQEQIEKIFNVRRYTVSHDGDPQVFFR